MQFFKQTINYKKCFLIGVIFQVAVYLLSNLLVLASRGGFPYPKTFRQAITFIIYIMAQGLLTAAVAALLHEKLPESRFKAGLVLGVLIFFFNNQVVSLITGIISLIYAVSNNVVGVNFLILSDTLWWLLLILIYLVAGVVMLFLLDKIYFKANHEVNGRVLE